MKCKTFFPIISAANKSWWLRTKKGPAATYSPTENRSTIGVRALNCRVRDGNGCVCPAVATGPANTRKHGRIRTAGLGSPNSDWKKTKRERIKNKDKDRNRSGKRKRTGEEKKGPAATYSPTENRSTIGVRALNCRVRDGNGCVCPAVATGPANTGEREIFSCALSWQSECRDWNSDMVKPLG